MQDPAAKNLKKQHKQVKLKQRLTGLFLFLENITAAFWQPFSWTVFFAGLWLMNIPAIFGPYGPPFCAVIFYTGFIYLFFRNIKFLRLPTRTEINSRLEHDSGMKHRPVTTLEDKLSNKSADRETEKLWALGRQRAYDNLDKLHVTAPHPLLSRFDPAGLRALAVLAFITGLVISGPEAPARLSAGAFPFAAGSLGQGGQAITLWIIPPEYTGYDQLVMHGDVKENTVLAIPAGSTVKARVNEGLFTPTLEIGNIAYKLEKIGKGSWGAEETVTPGQMIRLRQWPLTTVIVSYNYLQDNPPVIELNGEPVPQENGKLRLPLKLTDDYGVEDLDFSVRLAETKTPPPFGTAFNETRAILSPGGTTMEIAPVYDLAWHPWAGMPVIISVTARDGQDQKAALPPLHLTLPERDFRHPVAAQLVDMRKRLIWTPEAAASNIAHEIEEIMAQPGNYQGDILVFLGLRSAASRLYYNKDSDSIRDVIALLWDIALHIEEGNLPMAARNLEEARQALENLLRNPDAADEQIAMAMDELRRAMAEYMKELYREMQKKMGSLENLPMLTPQTVENMVDLDDIAGFLDRLQAEAMTGNAEAAREMLSQLQQFMDMMNAQGNLEMPPQMEFMAEGINELQELIDRQQQLLEQTREQAQKAIPPVNQYYPEFDLLPQALQEKFGFGDMPPPPGTDKVAPLKAPNIDTGDHKVEQDALRYILGQLMLEADQMLGEIPAGMQNAEQEMRRAANNLGNNAPGGAIPHQQKAIEYLQQSMNNMSRQMQAMMKQMTGFSFGMGPMDPLGRPMQEGEGNNMFSGSRVKIPEESRRKKVKEILELLRRRSGELRRPDYELEYYRRLMKQF